MPVYQEKNKTKCTKDGRSWYFKCYYTNMYGKKRQKMSKYFLTKKEAKEAEMTFLTQISIIDETDHDILFTTVYSEWLVYKKAIVKSPTYYSIKKKSDKHILKFFEPFKLHSIKTNNILTWREELLNKELSPNSKNVIIGYMQNILEYAVNNFDYDKKVSSKLQKQRLENVKDKTNDAETNFWTYNEFEKFIKTVTNESEKLMYLFLYYTGLRFGEFDALTWYDIDLDKKKLRINKTLTNKVEGKIYEIIDPKTSNSVRTIDLDDELTELLKLHKKKEKEIINFTNDMFVFGNVRYIAYTTFKKHLDNWIKIAEVKRITPHGFRHSHASLLIHLGCDSRDVADRLGDTVETVEETYAHLFPEKRAITINKINELKNEYKK